MSLTIRAWCAIKHKNLIEDISTKVASLATLWIFEVAGPVSRWESCGLRLKEDQMIRLPRFSSCIRNNKWNKMGNRIEVYIHYIIDICTVRGSQCRSSFFISRNSWWLSGVPTSAAACGRIWAKMWCFFFFLWMHCFMHFLLSGLFWLGFPHELSWGQCTAFIIQTFRPHVTTCAQHLPNMCTTCAQHVTTGFCPCGGTAHWSTQDLVFKRLRQKREEYQGNDVDYTRRFEQLLGDQ